jgi:DNA-binding MarR family transcriptional regulator
VAIKQILNALNLEPGTVIRVERLVLLELANMADSRKGNTCYPGIEHLEGKTGYGGTAIKDAIRSLIRKDFVSKKRRFGTSNYYVVHISDYK